MRALIRQRRAGVVSADQFHVYKRAAYSGLPIASGGESATFTQHLRKAVAKIHPDKETAGALLDDLRNFDWWAIFNQLTNWLIENWFEVVKLIVPLLLFLGQAERAETE